MDLHIENILTAKTFADKEVYVIPMMSGKVESIMVEVGERVAQDDVLFVMDKEDIDKQVNQALSAYESAKASYEVTLDQIENAKKTFQRIETLYNEGVVAESQYDEAKIASSDANLEAAKKAVEQARISYENTASASKDAVVKSPISGIVSNIDIVEGDFASPNQPPMTIVDSDNITVEVGVPANIINKVNIGDQVTVEISAADYKEDSVVDSISSSADPITNLYIIKIVLSNDGTIKPGMFAKVYLNTDNIENTLAVKAEAIKESDDRKYVFVAEGDYAVKKEVVTGLDNGYYIEIKEGLNVGDKVITVGQDYVNDGSKIKIVRGE
jgi:RND family efflux transporter MFP subunit